MAADPSRESDERLVTASLTGAPEAVSVVSGWARQIATHRAWGFETTEDIVQATLLAVVQNLRAGRFAPGYFQAYVRRIARNQCLTSYRRARVRRRRVSLREETIPSPAGDQEAEAARRRMLDRILAQLDDDCRRLLVMAYCDELSHREIASRLGISVGAARVRLFRCVVKARHEAQRRGLRLETG